MVARGLTKLPPWPRLIVAMAIAILAGHLLRTLVYDPNIKADWRGATAIIARHDPTAAVVLLNESPSTMQTDAEIAG